MTLRKGSDVGRYQVDVPLGEGGMQQVYRAHDTLFGRHVVLKVPKNDDGERRFERSAHAAARVNHTNVARTLDFLDVGGRRYLVEEYVHGLDLGKLLKQVPRLDPYMVARVLHGMARGVAAVHGADVVHRDLKPSNVMVAGGLAFADVKITDFGVARMAIAEIDDALAGGDLSLTGSKTLIGHLPYLAPEVLRDRKTVDRRADVWAVGALAFHLLSGRPPFGHELAEAVVKILSAPVPQLPPDVSGHPQFGPLGREIYGIAAACMQRDPGARPTAPQLVDLCGRLCYPVSTREVGRVTGYPGNTFGFASADADGAEVFFHVDSVFGKARPAVGGQIWFSRHPGHPYPRAHPVVPLMAEEP